MTSCTGYKLRRGCLLAAASLIACAQPAQAQFARPERSAVEKMVDDLKPSRMPRTDRPRAPLPQDAPMPSADPRDFSGAWMHLDPLIFRNTKDMYQLDVPFNEAGIKILARRIVGDTAGTPYLNASAICRPTGPFWQLDLNFPFQIFHTEKGQEWVFEEFHGLWNIAYDPADLPRQTDAPYMGNSIGHWEGDTLVVETQGFKHSMWLDVEGVPISASAKITFRVRKVNLGDRNPYLDMSIMIDDPAYYTKPWSIARRYHWRPNRAIFKEYNCEEQVGDPNASPDSGLVPEPND